MNSYLSHKSYLLQPVLLLKKMAGSHMEISEKETALSTF